MAVNLSPVGGVAAQFFDNSGNVLTGGKIYTYSAGTTTPVATYTTSAGSVAWSNPIVLDASGRVSGSGEIWLTDGIQYKFLLKDSNDVLIATYDNIVGINSNFVNFTNQQEIQTATAGQTVFNLATTTYQPGTNSLSVFVDGVNQYGSGAQYAYIETDENTVTFTSGLHIGAEVKFTTSQLNTSSANDAGQISYTYPDTNAVSESVEDRLAQYVSVKDFGAIGNGVIDDTTAIQNTIDAVGTNGGGTVYFPAGSYLISSPITNSAYNFVNIEGAGRNATRVFGDSSSLSSVFYLGGGASGPFRCSIKNMSIDTAQIGVDVNSGSTNTELENLVISTSVFGVKNTGNYTVSPVRGNQGTHLNKLEISGYSNSGIYNYCASELYWDEIVCNGGGTAACGIYLDSASNAVYASRANLLSNTYGMLIADTTGVSPNPTSAITTPSQMWFSKILGDTSVTGGIYVNSGFEINLIDCWGSGSTNGYGIIVGGTVADINLVGCRALGNSKHGLLLEGANTESRVKVTGGMFANNGYATSNTYDGINIENGFGNFNIVGATCYNDTGLGLSSTQRYGIKIETGSSDNFAITGCVNNNNLSGGISNGATGTNVQIFGNIPLENNNKLKLGSSGTALQNVMFGSTTYNCPSTPTGSMQTTAVTVTGVLPGDVCIPSYQSITTGGWLVTALVTSADTVAVTLLNMTGATVDPASGTLSVVAFRAS